MDHIAKFIRVATIAPIMALALICAVSSSLGGWVNILFSIVCLTILPVLAYPLQLVLPGWKAKGREGQRNLAIIMAVIGYLAGAAYGFLFGIPKALWIIYLTYLVSGLGIVVFNQLLKIKASGHACGVVGPYSLFIYLADNSAAFMGVFLVALVYWASLRMKRHTVSQLLYGSAIPVVSLGISIYLVHLFSFI